MDLIVGSTTASITIIVVVPVLKKPHGLRGLEGSSTEYLKVRLLVALHNVTRRRGTQTLN